MEMRQRVLSEFGARVDEIVERSEELQRLPFILPHSHFAPPASEARKMYRMGYYFGAIMVAQSTAEALARFIAESKGMSSEYYCERDERNGGVSQAKRLEDLKQAKKITARAFKHFRRILEHKRNSFHHMNQDIPIGPEALRKMAFECVESLYSIEGAFLGVVHSGRVHVRDKELWDVLADGTVGGFIDGTLL